MSGRAVGQGRRNDMFGQRTVSSRFCASIALVCLVSLPARAEGELVRDAMSSIGLIEPERPTITYRERAPLAMPPKLGGKDLTAGLPVPQPRRADPQWPKDPEISRRERQVEENNRPVARGAQGRMNDNNETLSAYEMQAGRKAGAGLSSEPSSLPGENRNATWLNPLDLFRDAKQAPSSDIEPSREGLTDPPVGYRKPPVKVAAPAGAPVGGSISGNEEADPRAYLREQRR